MTPLPKPLGTGDLVFWRIDAQRHAASWDTGMGAYLLGGRWNSAGTYTVYGSLDPATTILERAAHTGFNALDEQRHVVTSARVLDPADVHIVQPDTVPNPHWLNPGSLSAAQQRFGDELTARHRFVLVPSTISQHSWNVIFNPEIAAQRYRQIAQERFALDPRLNRAANDYN